MSFNRRFKRRTGQTDSERLAAFQDWMYMTLNICLKRCNNDGIAGAELFNVIMNSLGVPGFEGALVDQTTKEQIDAVV